MSKSDYIKKSESAFSAQLGTFQANIGSYSAALSLSPAQVAAQAADADYYAHVVKCQDLAGKFAQQWTAWRDLLRDGGSSGAASAPVVVNFPPAVTAVAPGIEARFRALARLIKAQPAYNDGIGAMLGIEGTAAAAVDLSQVKPKISLEIQGGQVFVRWSWQGMSQHLDMIELCVDRGDGRGFLLLAQDTTPNYLDSTPLPATPVKWIYKAIFRVGDQRVGQWSDEVSIVVGD